MMPFRKSTHIRGPRAEAAARSAGQSPRALPVRGALWLVMAFALLPGMGCRQQPGNGTPVQTAAVSGAGSASRNANPPVQDSITFKDITLQSGINFTHFSGARGKMYMPECETPGCAFLDYNNDGRPDILLLNGADWPEVKTGRKHSRMALYRNDGNGHFTDVTKQAGLDIEMHSMGVAVGDYDNDGWEDIYITCALEPSRLFHNEHGKFRDVTQQAGVDNQSRWGSAAVWFDYDNDGKLDLFVGNYCKWTPQTDVSCHAFGQNKTYCTPNVYDGEPCRLYHNNGDGTFTDVSVKTGLRFPQGKTWGAALLDYNDDGKLDIVLANDMEPTALYRNNGDGTFTDVALETGVALAETGAARSGMGIDTGDLDNSGRESLLTSNFSGEGISFFYNAGNGMFQERSARAGLADTSLLFMGWGLLILDYDLDGSKDIFVANGHLYPEIHTFQPDITYAERPLLYHNQGGLKFAEVGLSKGDMAQPSVARGSAYADIDGDGDLDILIANNGGRPCLLRNDGGNKNNWLRIQLVGRKSNRDGIGAKIEMTADGRTQMLRVRSGSSYLSASERIATFGLAQGAQAQTLQITWPSGQKDRYSHIAADALLVAFEGKNMVAYPQQDRRVKPTRYSPE